MSHEYSYSDMTCFVSSGVGIEPTTSQYHIRVPHYRIKYIFSYFFFVSFSFLMSSRLFQLRQTLLEFLRRSRKMNELKPSCCHPITAMLHDNFYSDRAFGLDNFMSIHAAVILDNIRKRVFKLNLLVAVPGVSYSITLKMFVTWTGVED